MKTFKSIYPVNNFCEDWFSPRLSMDVENLDWFWEGYESPRFADFINQNRIHPLQSNTYPIFDSRKEWTEREELTDECLIISCVWSRGYLHPSMAKEMMIGHRKKETAAGIHMRGEALEPTS